MFSNNFKVDDPGLCVIDYQRVHNPVISCVVSHTVSVQPRSAMTSEYIIKMACFLGLTLCSILATIVACITSQVAKPALSLPPQGPVDGLWSGWNPWSKCSISCSSFNKSGGTMTRVRFCNSPPPQESGRDCQGPASEETECFRAACPIPVDGQWAEWTQWSDCSATCQYKGSIPRQTRSSSCSDPAPKNGGKECEGESFNERFCTWLPQCPVNGQWGEWFVSGACESVNMKSCALGKKLYQRQCNKPPPSSTGKECEGVKEKNEDCWFDIGCPIALQPPLELQVFGNGSGVFEIKWLSVPYGEVAVKYRIYLTIEDANRTQVETVHQNVSSIPPKEVAGRRYSTIADMRRFLRYANFDSLVVRMSSFDFWDKESLFTNPVKSKAKGVDGQWGVWDHWSDCSTQCLNQLGSRTRKRICNLPTPKDGGKDCIGNSEMEVSCMGMGSEC